jgi:P27 family predicted phage terminase small subunit
MNYRCPVELSDSAKKIWKTVIKELRPSQVITIVDLYSIAAYCMEMDLYFHCMGKIATTSGVTKMIQGTQVLNIVSPYYKNAKTALNNAKSIGDRFGFNLLSRQKIKNPDDSNEKDVLDEV